MSGPDTPAARAVDTALGAVGVGASGVAVPRGAEVACRLVTRLDGRTPYFLVGITVGDRGWVVAVTADGSEIRQMASDPTGARSWWADARGDLVWAPGSWSRSPFHPLQRVVDDGREVLLDHLGQPVPDTPPGPG